MGNIVIIGAGNVGRTLLSFLEAQKKHNIKVVEKNYEKCNELASETSATVINADATDPSSLDELELEDVDYFFAVSGSEETNFLAGAYAKQAGAKKVICRVKSRKYSKVLEKVGIESVVSEYTLAVELANRVSSPTIYRFLNPSESGFELFEKEVDKKMIGKTLSELPFNKDTLVIALYKDGKYYLAKEEMELEKGMTLIAIRQRHKSII